MVLQYSILQGVSKKTEFSGNHYNFCYRPRIILSNMSFRMRKARPVHLRHKNYIVKHFNCLKIGRNGRRQRGSYLFSDLRISVKMSAPTFAAAFKAVKMLKHLVFMSQMDRPCFSHSKTHVGKYNPRSVAKVIVISTKLSFFLDTLYFY